MPEVTLKPHLIQYHARIVLYSAFSSSLSCLLTHTMGSVTHLGPVPPKAVHLSSCSSLLCHGWGVPWVTEANASILKARMGRKEGSSWLSSIYTRAWDDWWYVRHPTYAEWKTDLLQAPWAAWSPPAQVLTIILKISHLYDSKLQPSGLLGCYGSVAHRTNEGWTVAT